MTENIKFARVIAKNNFKFDTAEELKESITKQMLSETGLIVATDKKKARSILSSDGSLEIQQEVKGEAIAFLKDESAVSVKLIQMNAHGIFKFVYVLKLVVV